MNRIGFIGAGNMAGAIITNLLAQNRMTASQVGVFDTASEVRERYLAAGHPVYDSVESLTRSCDTIVLSVKPQVIPAVLPEMKKAMTPNKLVVSIAAGIGAQTIQQGVGFPCKLILVMPNTPILLGAGAAAMSRVEPATIEDFERVREIFALAGIAEEVLPEQMNAVMSVHGTMPAYLYLFAKTIVDCAEQAGIDREAANRLFCQTLIGASKMMTQTGKSHQELIDMVCSPGGTTLAGLSALDHAGFVPALQAAFAASTRRAEELAQ